MSKKRGGQSNGWLKSIVGMVIVFSGLHGTAWTLYLRPEARCSRRSDRQYADITSDIGKKKRDEFYSKCLSSMKEFGHYVELEQKEMYDLE